MHGSQMLREPWYVWLWCSFWIFYWAKKKRQRPPDNTSELIRCGGNFDKFLPNNSKEVWLKGGSGYFQVQHLFIWDGNMWSLWSTFLNAQTSRKLALPIIMVSYRLIELMDYNHVATTRKVLPWGNACMMHSLSECWCVSPRYAVEESTIINNNDKNNNHWGEVKLNLNAPFLDMVTSVEIVPVSLTEASTRLQVEIANLVEPCKEQQLPKKHVRLEVPELLSWYKKLRTTAVRDFFQQQIGKMTCRGKKNHWSNAKSRI